MDNVYDDAMEARSSTALNRPPYDPEIEAFLDIVLEQMPPKMDIGNIDELRKGALALCTPIESVIKGHDLEHIEHLIPGLKGTPPVALSIVRKPGLTNPVPCIFNIHGGGMISLNRFFGSEEFVVWAERFGAAVVTVEYRLAPEHPHPAPVEDCYAGLSWIFQHAADLSIDPKRILLVGGSAGGGLAAAVALMARDRRGPALIGQALYCPMLDDRNESTSSRQFDGRSMWSRSSNLIGWTALLGNRRGEPDVSPYASPARATDLGNLPPAFIDVGSAEVFRDEAVDYASRIWAAGGQAELHVWAGVSHGFERISHAVVTQAAIETRYNWIGRILGYSSIPA